MKTLIKMKDFVLEQKQSVSYNEKTFINEELIALEKIRNYAKFLKQPLTLGMFMSKAAIAMNNGANRDVVDSLDESEDNFSDVLFEGFEVIRSGVNSIVSNGKIDLFKWKSVDKTWGLSINGNTIEDLSNLGLTLTPAALKQLEYETVKNV